MSQQASDQISMKDKVFFSYATVAPMAKHVYEAVQEFQREFFEVGPPEVLYKYDPMSDDLAQEAASLLKCDPSEITYIKNTSEGVVIAAESLPLNEGDEILVLGAEYPANFLPWLKKRKDGMQVTVVSGNGPEGFQNFIGAISPKTKAIAVSYIQYYDGYVTDVAQLSRICREKGIYLVVDAAQALGVIDIDLTKTPVDFLFSGSQKYICAGPGSGVMYVNKDTLGKLRDFKVGIRSMDHFDENEYALKDSAARFQDGTQNLSGIVATLAALRHINKIGMGEIERQNKAFLKEAKACLTRYDIPFIDHGEQQGNIISMKVSDPVALFLSLKERGVYLKPIKDVARLSFINESRIEDLETLARLTREWIDANS